MTGFLFLRLYPLTKSSPNHCPQPDQRPQSVYIKQLVPRMKRSLAEYFAPLDNAGTSIVCAARVVIAIYLSILITAAAALAYIQSERCETADSVAKLSVLLASHLPQQHQQAGAESVKALTHIVISYSEKTNFVLEKQGMSAAMCPPSTSNILWEGPV